MFVERQKLADLRKERSWLKLEYDKVMGFKVAFEKEVLNPEEEKLVTETENVFANSSSNPLGMTFDEFLQINKKNVNNRSVNNDGEAGFHTLKNLQDALNFQVVAFKDISAGKKVLKENFSLIEGLEHEREVLTSQHEEAAKSYDGKSKRSVSEDELSFVHRVLVILTKKYSS